MGNEAPAALRLLLLFSNTGGGHRAAAEALRQEFLRRNPHHQVFLEDILLERTFWPLSEGDRFYFWAVTQAPRFWKALYTLVAQKPVYTLLHYAMAPVLMPRLQRLYDRYRPDLVVSLHPLLNHLPRRALRRWEARHGRPRVPFATVITDLTTFHPSWVDPEVDLITVATEEAQRTVWQLGASPAKVRLLGLPVRAAFCNLPQDPARVRRELGLDPQRPVLLLMSGGQGMGPVEAIATALATARPPAQLVIVAGRNAALQRRLSARTWPIPTWVLGFVDNVHLWMVASDILITKAGPGTIAEALICGLPMILYGYIPGQEEGNVDFVVQRGIGAYEERPERIAALVREWLAAPQQTLVPMRQRALALARPRATEAIVDALLALVRTAPLPAEGAKARIAPPAGDASDSQASA